MSGDQAVATLIEEVRSHMSILFKICEAIALLDMVGLFNVRAMIMLTHPDRIFRASCHHQ